MATEANNDTVQQAAGATSSSEHSAPFDPSAFLLVPPRTFDELQVGRCSGHPHARLLMLMRRPSKPSPWTGLTHEKLLEIG
jgi:hypothetical protein